MKVSHTSRPLWLALAGCCLISVPVFAADVTNCDKVSAEVMAAVEKEPQKVLVIVEDEIVAHESCAGEIVKAAILASKANGDLIKQIVLTAKNISPKMSAIIADSASGVAPELSKEATDSMKKAMDVQPTSEGDDYKRVPSDIRGVYLIQPSAGGVIRNPAVEKKKVVVVRKPPTHSIPLSPSEADLNCKK